METERTITLWMSAYLSRVRASRRNKQELSVLIAFLVQRSWLGRRVSGVETGRPERCE